VSGFKKALFGQFAKIGKAVSSANRLEMLEFLTQCEYSVEDLAGLMELSVANTSHHLQHLRQAGLVTTRKSGQRVFYRVNGEDVIELVGSLRTVAQRHLAEVDQLVNSYLTGKDDLEPITREELLQRVKEGSVLVLDVRPSPEYRAGHLPGAVNISLADLKKQFADFDPELEIVAYCRGPYCVLAFEAVKLLRGKRFRARRLQDGYPEWKGAGLPVEGDVPPGPMRHS
jgi:rhodanese-related sulfurtransferase/DNA-binding transcriptional ArsR family regulator